MTEYREIKLPDHLCVEVERKFATSFSSIQQLLEFVLIHLADQQVEELDAAEQQAIEKRLRDLGYM